MPAFLTRMSSTRRDIARPLVFAISIVLGFMMAASSVAQARTIRIVALGDSLTAGYLLAGADAFPSVLEKALRAKGIDVAIENAGVSGDTATGGLERLDWSVPEGTDGVIVELGANDALRGLDPDITEKALDQIMARLKARKIAVLLAGMLAPRNNGEAYAKAFDAIYPRLAQKHGVPLHPFFLDGIAGDPKLNLSDLLHPNPAGVRVIVDRILPVVEPFVRGLARP